MINKFLAGKFSTVENLEKFWNACYQINADRAWRSGELGLTFDEVTSKFESFGFDESPRAQAPASLPGLAPAPVAQLTAMDSSSPAILQLVGCLTKAMKRGAPAQVASRGKQRRGSGPGPKWCNQYNSPRGCRNQLAGDGCLSAEG